MIGLRQNFSGIGQFAIAEVPSGSECLLVAEVIKEVPDKDLLFISRDEMRMAAMGEALSLIAPGEKILQFPAWDCLPYDRVSPKRQVVARRMRTLSQLVEEGERSRIVLLSTCNASLQRIQNGANLQGEQRSASTGDTINITEFATYLSAKGYSRSGQVMEPGEFAVRGNIMDVFPADGENPVRIDLLGDLIEAIREFDPLSQRSTKALETVHFASASELLLDPVRINRFRENYRRLFGAVTTHDPLYESVSEGRQFDGMEHWLPLFYDSLSSIFDYLPNAAIMLDDFLEISLDTRISETKEFYETRAGMGTQYFPGSSPKYKPVPLESMFLSRSDWDRKISTRAVALLNSFGNSGHKGNTIGFYGKKGRDFSNERRSNDVGLFEELGIYLKDELSAGKRIVVACQSQGSRDRLQRLFFEHQINNTKICTEWEEIFSQSIDIISLIVFPLQTGFEIPDLRLISEGDILGNRLTSGRRSSRRAHDFLSDATKLAVGDLVVHVEHGVGRFEGLETIETSSAPHDCLKILYSGGDHLYLPVENIEMVGRYGSSQEEVRLDTLGTNAWKNRKSRVKAQIRDMAAELIQTAAERVLKKADPLILESSAYEEFCGRFPYWETEDQLRGIDDCLADISTSVPMDRLICGDVGFGKTEVALRTAFVAVQSGKQVAVVTPTTLLSRQHFETFVERFKGFPFLIAQLSRLVSGKESTKVRDGLESGAVDIVIGTHALLAKSINFKRLGLFIIDEEQHFGVAQKERLKSLKSAVHVLTLTATPIPRTLQLALSGVRSMSVIATPPIDRLAVRTFILPYDGVVIKEAILREQSRGGQIFYICPQIRDLQKVSEYLSHLVPDTRIIVAHGQMSPHELDSAMTAFYERRFDLLLATSIIESGLDIPTVNTLIVHRSDRFGLAQLYQLRGRVGRSKVRAYAYFTVSSPNFLKGDALKRLEALHQLDSVGSGFSLSSHDLDIRGAGNLLGEEQSGKVGEIGVELYQQLLSEAVAEESGRPPLHEKDQFWSPQIELGAAILIPEMYVPDLSVRLGLYRRLGALELEEELQSFAVEIVDRFGPIPPETEHLLRVVRIKQMCRSAYVAQIDAGPRGAVLTFFNDSYPAGEKLIKWIIGV